MLTEQILDIYPARDFLIPHDAFTAFLGEAVFICPALSAGAVASAGAPSFAYHFTRSPLLTRLVGAAHGIELPYVFGNFTGMGIVPTPSDTRVSAMLQRAWGTFAHHGAPSFPAGWNDFDPAAPEIAIVDDPAEIVSEIRSGRCDALRSLGIVP